MSVDTSPPPPTFLIIGARKSATRWLRTHLGQHPEVFTAGGEIRFFNDDESFARAAASIVAPSDLGGETALLPEALEAGCVYRGQFERQLAKAGVVPPETMEFQSMEAVKRRVAAGMGVSVLPTVTRIPCRKRGAKIPSSNPLRERHSLSCGHDRETSVLW